MHDHHLCLERCMHSVALPMFVELNCSSRKLDSGAIAVMLKVPLKSLKHLQHNWS